MESRHEDPFTQQLENFVKENGITGATLGIVLVSFKSVELETLNKVLGHLLMKGAIIKLNSDGASVFVHKDAVTFKRKNLKLSALTDDSLF